jgi:hypothetical protein
MWNKIFDGNSDLEKPADENPKIPLEDKHSAPIKKRSKTKKTRNSGSAQGFDGNSSTSTSTVKKKGNKCNCS